MSMVGILIVRCFQEQRLFRRSSTGIVFGDRHHSLPMCLQPLCAGKTEDQVWNDGDLFVFGGFLSSYFPAVKDISLYTQQI